MERSLRPMLGLGAVLVGLLLVPIGAAGSQAPASGPLVALSIADGRIAGRAPAFAPQGSYVDAVVADGHSGWYVGGRFQQVGGVRCPYLAHVLPQLEVDRAWCPRPNGEVQRLAVSGDTVFVAGGAMTRVGGLPRKGVAAVDAGTGKVLPWNARPDRSADGRGLAVQGSTLYVTGAFEHIGGKARYQLAALDTRTARATAWNPHPFYIHGDPSVTAVVPGGAIIFVEGYFDGVGGSVRPGFAALDATTGRATPFRPPGSFAVVADAKLYLLVLPPACGVEWTPVCAKSTSIAYDLPRLGRDARWKAAAKGVFAADGPYVYAYSRLSQYGDPQAREALVALDPATGALRWRSSVFARPLGDSVSLTVASSAKYALVGGNFRRVG